MHTHVENAAANESQLHSSASPTRQADNQSAAQFMDVRHRAVAQRKLQDMANNSPRVKQLRSMQEAAQGARDKKAAQLRSISSSSSLPVQRYKEQQSKHSSDVDAAWDAREAMKITAYSYMNHNVAVDYNDEKNYARSSQGGHAENFVFSAFAIQRGDEDKLNIVSEREPCGDCEDNLKALEKIANPKLAITVDYFIKYKEGEGGGKLWKYYKDNGKVDASSDDGSDSGSDSGSEEMSD
jgi:hypothetical protein